MVEVYRLPGRLLRAAIVLLHSGWVMAGLTFFAITTSMLIIQAVARVTVTRDVLPALIRMTKIAGHLLMGTLELELGLFMSEAVFCPLVLLVAVLAFFTEAPLVR